MVSKAATIDEYLAALDPEPRAELERIRALVTSLVPDAVESMSYRPSPIWGERSSTSRRRRST